MNKLKFNEVRPIIIPVVIGLILAFLLLFILTYFQYYIHESGHAGVALFSSFMQKNPHLTINFTYVDFPLMKSLKVPQQTRAIILTRYTILFNLAGVFATILFYVLILFLVSRIKIIRDKKILEIPLIISFLILIFQNIGFNLFCGTDGLKLGCSEFVKSLMFFIFTLGLLISLGFFFTILTILIKNNKNKTLQ